MALKDFDSFIIDFKQSLKNDFEKWNDCHEKLTSRGFSEELLKSIMSHNPLSTAIPKEHGGRGMDVRECLSVLEAASYESLSLSLMFGINIALFLEPLYKYGDESVKARVYKNFLENQAMGGLMISEPDHGSDALNMQTSVTRYDNYSHIQGVKHWQGLTGMANYWLIACREKAADGNLMKDICIYCSDDIVEEQTIHVEKYYSNNGLFAIPYGKNIIDIKVPNNQELKSESSGIKMLMDILHRSRMQFPGMAMGFIRRIMESAIENCQNRKIRGHSLLQFDNVNFFLSKLQSYFTICSAMCYRSTQISSAKNNLAMKGFEANIIKAYVTDLMQKSAHLLVQLQGANGYKILSLGSRAIMDSRPFQIFEGPNEMLFSQIAEATIKQMRKKKESNLLQYLKTNKISSRGVEVFNDRLNFSLEFKGIPQRKMVVLGEIISMVVCANYVLEMGDKSFNKELITNCLSNLSHEMDTQLGSFKSSSQTVLVEDFGQDSQWSALEKAAFVPI